MGIIKRAKEVVKALDESMPQLPPKPAPKKDNGKKGSKR